jgi:hypothetical protein
MAEIIAPSIDVNEHHLSILNSPSRQRCVAAGRGFGKTNIINMEIYNAAQRLSTDAHGRPLKPNIGVFYPTREVAKEVLWRRAKEFFTPYIKSKNETELSCELINGARFRLVGANFADRKRGSYLTDAIVDEAAIEMPDLRAMLNDVINPMLFRVRPVGRITLFSSVGDESDDFWQIHQSGDDWESFTFNSIQGGFMDASAIEAARKDHTLESWLAEYWSIPRRSHNRVYYGFNRERNCKPVQWLPGMDIHWFWDFNMVPSCHSGLAHLHNGKAFVFDEICTGTGEAVAREFCIKYPWAKIREGYERVRQLYSKAPSNDEIMRTWKDNTPLDERGMRNAGPKIYLYGDASGGRSAAGGDWTDYAAIKSVLKEHGYPEPILKVTGSNPLVKRRIQTVNTRLHNAANEVSIVINGETCPKLVKDLEKVKHGQNGDLDKTGDRTLTHISDALGYFVMTVMPLTQQIYPIMSREYKVLSSHYGHPVEIVA